MYKKSERDERERGKKQQQKLGRKK